MTNVQNLQPDRLFNEEQQKRLAELMGRWRTARDREEALPVAEQSELEELIEAELRAAGDRAVELCASRPATSS